MTLSAVPPVVYVVSRLPVGSQTFVEREWKAVGSKHDQVFVYSLEPFAPTLFKFESSDASLKSCVSGSRAKHMVVVVFAILASLVHLSLRVPTVLKFAKLFCTDRSSLVRFPYVLLHSLILGSLLRIHLASRAHIHAHFLGRTFEVAFGTTLVLTGLTVSGTGHAGDVHTPMSVRRLRALVNGADQVVGASDDISAKLASYILPGNNAPKTVRCGVSSNSLRNVDSFESWPQIIDSKLDTPRILSVGRMVPKKGFDDCLDAAKILREANFSYSWVNVGDGPLLDPLRSLARDQCLSSVQFVGALENSEVMALLGGWADIFVLPAKPAANGDADGIPVVLMEAMYCGVPVVTTHTGGIRELVAESETGWIVSCGDPTALAFAVTSLWADHQKRERITENARRLVNEKFNTDTEAVKLLSIFSRIAHSGEAARP